jgi:hypothetical protein
MQPSAAEVSLLLHCKAGLPQTAATSLSSLAELLHLEIHPHKAHGQCRSPIELLHLLLTAWLTQPMEDLEAGTQYDFGALVVIHLPQAARLSMLHTVE